MIALRRLRSAAVVVATLVGAVVVGLSGSEPTVPQAAYAARSSSAATPGSSSTAATIAPLTVRRSTAIPHDDAQLADATTAPSVSSTISTPSSTTTVAATLITATASTTSATSTTSVPDPVVRSGATGPVPSEVGVPRSISIPSLGVRSDIVETGSLDDGTIAVPESVSIAGWYTDGPRPGEPGPAVVVSHVDSARDGPGVFYHLRDIVVGARVSIDSDVGTVHFEVQEVELHPKDAFPTEHVYGAVHEPSLRLITCGGEFDRATGHYRDNVVVMLRRAEP